MSSKTYNIDIKIPKIPKQSKQSILRYGFTNAFGIWNNNTYNLVVNNHFIANFSENDNEIIICIMFYDIEHRNEFEIWYKKYMMFFDDSNYLICSYPVFQKSSQIQGYFYYQSPKDNNDYYYDDSYLEKQFYYIVEHFDPPVYLIDKACWLLKNEQEAIILKLNT